MNDARVLIVDDEPEIRAILGDLISPITKNFVEAENGAIALEAVKKNYFHAIITDLNMHKNKNICRNCNNRGNQND